MNILWSSLPDQNGNYQFIRTIKGKAEKVILRGVSLNGLEYLPKDKKDITNILLSFFDPEDPTTHTLKNFTTIVKNIIDVLCDEWRVNLVRLPICLSAYSEIIQIYFQGDNKSYSYPRLVKIIIGAILDRDNVAVIDGHLWATDPETSKMAYPKYCSFDLEQNRPTNTQNYGIQLYALQDLMEVPTGKPVPGVVSAWNAIVADTLKSFDNNQNIWYEFINEPFYRPFTSQERTFSTNRIRFRNWKTFFHTLIKNTREIAPNNILIVNGLDRGYDFQDAINELSAIPYQNLRSLFSNDNKNIAYGVHPFQIASCCGLVTSPGDDPNVIDTIRRIYIPYKNPETSTLLLSDKPYTMDQSIFDPYEKAYCNFPGKISNRNTYQDNMKGKAFSIPSPEGNQYFDLPSATQNTDLNMMKCDHSFNKSQSKKLPPCQFDDRLIDARTGTEYVGTYIGDCPNHVVKALKSKKFDVPSSGWNKYFLGMRKYGPVIATAFGTFDCSLPYIKAFLEYAEMNSLSWVAFGIQPYMPHLMYKKNLNPCNLSCLTISALSPAIGEKRVKSVLPSGKRIGNYMECADRQNCSLVLTPIGNKDGYGDTIRQYMRLNKRKEQTSPPKPSPPEPEPESKKSKKKPQPSKPETKKPETKKPQPSKPETIKPQPSKPETKEPTPSKPTKEPEPKTKTPRTTTISPEITTTTSPPIAPSPRYTNIGYYIVVFIILLVPLYFLLRFIYRNRQAIMNFLLRRPQFLATPPLQVQMTRRRVNVSSPVISF